MRLEWIDEGDPTELFIELEKCGEGFVFIYFLFMFIKRFFFFKS